MTSLGLDACKASPLWSWGGFAWRTGDAVKARARKDLDVRAHALPVVVVLHSGQGHLVTSMSSSTTVGDDTEAYLHAYSVCRYPDRALVVDL
jgi:hypothetical protein